jgi:hypothetical protein
MAAATQLRASAEAYRLQAEIAASAVVATKKVATRGPVAVADTMAAYQALAVQQGAQAISDQLAEQGISAPLVAGVAATSLVGFSSAGQPLEAVIPNVDNLARFVATMIQDAGRTGGSLAIAARPSVQGYVRMIGSDNPCSRCIILAGKFYRWSAGFDRHPLCRCIHIPVDENVAGDLTTDPSAYFKSLSTEEQDAVFGKAGAQAIRDGADMNQVVNAGRSVYRAQEVGRDLKVTREGVTRFGKFGQANAARAGQGKPKLRYRLMPETIMDLAGGDRDESIRLLRLYGYLL